MSNTITTDTVKIKGRHTSSAIAVFLVLTIAVTLVALPTANAQNAQPTYAFIGANPNPVGVNQEVLLHIGITEANLRGVGYGWEGLSVTIERPDDKTETIEDITTDSTGGTGRTFVPDVTGTYYLQTHFPEQWLNYTGFDFMGNPVVVSILYAASSSEKLALNVTEEPREYYPGVPLPTEYWTRPINSQAREWRTISGNWLVGHGAGTLAEFVPYNDNAPETAHILWTRQLAEGGLAGGDTGDHAYVTGDAYQGKFANSIIINGVLYYNRFHTGFTASPPQQGIFAVDLHTGEELWFRNNTRLAFGQILDFISFNMQGTLAYLWETSGSTWNAYDPFTGEWVFTFNNVPSGTQVYGPNGEILIYTVDTANGWMTMWNSTKAVLDSDTLAGIIFGTGFAQGTYAPEGRTINATVYGLQWSNTIPTGLPGSVMKIFVEDKIIGSTAGTGIGAAMGTSPVVLWGISLKPGQEGHLLFNTTWTPPSQYLTVKMGAYDADLGVFTLWIKETRTHYGFSLDTGKQLWGPTDPQPYQDSFLWGEWHFTTAYGIYFSAATSGIVYAYDMKTGALLWTYEATDTYTETMWLPNWELYTAFITDGKIYLYHTEHSGNTPLPRGAPFICLNVTTGDEIFRIDGLRGTYWGGTALIGDSIIAFHDTYDQRIYTIGKGPSATTVTAAPEVSVHGSSVLLKGMVTDVSSGTEEYALDARFPNGVPAVSDESMSDWMKYVYMQFPRPANATGVEVTLSVLDPNNNYYEIGTATTDANGMYKLLWEPLVPGEYTVIATFTGTEGYWPSQAETAIGVTETPEATPPPTPTPAPMTDTYVLGTGITAIIAIIIIGLVLILMLRKR
jgi:hypothetical protein